MGWVCFVTPGTHGSFVEEYGRTMEPEQRRATRSTWVVLRQKAFEALCAVVGAVVALGVLIAIPLWLEADVFHERMNTEGLANLVMLVLLVAAVAAIGLTRGLRMAVGRVRKRRNP